MRIITGKHLPRRTFLRGVGASVALPFLDAMVPAGPLRRRVAPDLAQTRLLCIEEIHGLAGCHDWGSTQFLYAPETVGRDFDFVPASALKPLEPYREYLTIISNSDMRMGEAYTTPEIGGDHFRSSAVFLTQAHPKQTQSSDMYVGVSLDQLHAQRFGRDTALPSLELCIENNDQAGGCSYNYHCAYMDAISWASPSEPLPMIRDPRVVFDRLFGVGATPADRAARRTANRSILDWMGSELGRLKQELGPTDRRAVEQYLDYVREVERRIQKVEARNASGDAREMPEAPQGVPDAFDEHMHLMFDLQVLAFSSDLTRVSSLKMGRDAQNRTHPESGSSKSFHGASHHGNNKEAILEFNLISTYRLGMVTYLLDKLKSTMEGETHLLDKTVVIWGSPMGDANAHNHRKVPLFFLGHGNGILEGNLHLQAPDGTPSANVFLSLMHKLGHDDLVSFGDSTGEFSLDFPRGVSAAQASG
jgi:hypothetical protein